MVLTHPKRLYAPALRGPWAFVLLACLGIIAVHGQKRGFSVTADPSGKSEQNSGKYYALVIGINQYSAPMPQLKTAVNDAKAIASLLKDRYGFEVILLLDGQATRQAILNNINKYRSVLTENDSLLIYYGGHGYFDKDADKGYWLPVDAGPTQCESDHRRRSDQRRESAAIAPHPDHFRQLLFRRSHPECQRARANGQRSELCEQTVAH